MTDVFTYIELFRTLLDKRFTVNIVSDFAEFDITWVNTYGIMSGVRTLPLSYIVDPIKKSYSFQGSSISTTDNMYDLCLDAITNDKNKSSIIEYKKTHSTSKTLLFALNLDISKCPVVHDHYPEKDAAECVFTYFMILYTMRKYTIV